MDTLPADILLTIIDKLNFVDIISIYQTNKYFRNMIKEISKYIKHTVNINKTRYIENCIKIFPNVRVSCILTNDTLNIYSYLIKNYKINWYELDLSYCTKINDKIFNSSKIESIHTLKLTADTYTTNYISDISFKSDVFKNIHTMTIYNCNTITDLSPLCNIHNLTISGCNSITNNSIKNLGNVYRLRINQCDKITDVSPLVNVNTLILSYLNITNLPCLKNIYELQLYFCKYITSEHIKNADLSNIDNISIIGCPNIKSNCRNYEEMEKIYICW